MLAGALAGMAARPSPEVLRNQLRWEGERHCH